MFVNRLSPLFPIACAFLCVVVASGFAQTQENQRSGAAEARLLIVRQDATLIVSGNVSSAANEAILRGIAKDLFPDDRHDFTVTTEGITPPRWGLLGELTLRAIAETYSANGSISAERISIQGVTANFSGWQRAAQRINANLPADTTFVADVVDIGPTISLQKHCSSLFQEIWQDRSIAFARGSDQIKSSAFGILDELVQLLADCPAASLTVTGHTDNTGEEAGNLILSQARAQAVTAYMVSRGISQDRLSSAGAGSSQPLVAGADNWARQRNRRIDIEFSYP